MSNRRRLGTWKGKPLRLGENRHRARSLPRDRVPQPGRATIERLPLAALPLQVTIPRNLLRRARGDR
jgi:hypothetical protein